MRRSCQRLSIDEVLCNGESREAVRGVARTQDCLSPGASQSRAVCNPSRREATPVLIGVTSLGGKANHHGHRNSKYHGHSIIR